MLQHPRTRTLLVIETAIPKANRSSVFTVHLSNNSHGFHAHLKNTLLACSSHAQSHTTATRALEWLGGWYHPGGVPPVGVAALAQSTQLFGGWLKTGNAYLGASNSRRNLYGRFSFRPSATGSMPDLLDLSLTVFGVFLFLMIGISLNINGLGSDNKKNWVNRLIVHECPLVFGIQESKLNYVDQSVVRSLWPRTYVSYASSDFLGASGGIITMWDSRFFAMKHEFANRNFLGMVGSWTGVVSKVGLLNVYAPQDRRLKEVLWVSIQNLMNSFDVVWIVFGDFNVVRCQDERVGSVFDANDGNSFNDFLSRAGLFDFPLGGRKFTRFDKYGKKASKLDRFLASQNFFNCWNDASVSVL
ncbi:RNA-directed DNA polymerase, eukaryota [Tanacetum coccineum]|uniref:RNA-directed DNA polymerase, eukaryota n=1 Tax=Tanacetum coccineum TaxID=301880 RepID=A0ABQ5B6I7_9ASTR